MTPDSELLRQFARTNSQDAFAELVERHVNLVYSAALRQVNGDGHFAKDVAQTVFADLARKASSLSRRETLTGWLYTSAHFAAAKIVRGENRRRDREEKFMREPANENSAGVSPAPSAPEPDWEKIRPALDDAMHELKETDREAVLLRYFENRPFAEVGAKLGLNENAARMRVERALEKLRAIFEKRGIATATALASVISANAIQIAPANLAATLTAASIASAGTGTFTILKIMTATKLKLAFSALVIAGAATAFVIQNQTQEKLRVENDSLRRQMAQQIAQLQTDNENFSNRLAAAGDAKKLPDEQFIELLKLRGEVGVIHRQLDELGKLREENQRLNAQIADIQHQPVEVTRFLQHGADIFNAILQLGLRAETEAIITGGQYPTNLDQLEYNGVTNFPGNVRLSDFEIVNAGLVNASMRDKLFLRERVPRQIPVWRNVTWKDSGKWDRVYVFADGHTQTQTSEDGNFDAFRATAHGFAAAKSIRRRKFHQQFDQAREIIFFGVNRWTFGKYLEIRSASRVASFHFMISACAPMKKSGSGIFGASPPPEARRAIA